MNGSSFATHFSWRPCEISQYIRIATLVWTSAPLSHDQICSITNLDDKRRCSRRNGTRARKSRQSEVSLTRILLMRKGRMWTFHGLISHSVRDVSHSSHLFGTLYWRQQPVSGPSLSLTLDEFGEIGWTGMRQTRRKLRDDETTTGTDDWS